jgi:hypothetical protein
MKSTKALEIATTRPYPKLMESMHDGTIVLFSAERKGVCIHPGSDEDAFDEPSAVGKHFDHWDMNSFVDYHGTVTLQND